MVVATGSGFRVFDVLNYYIGFPILNGFGLLAVCLSRLKDCQCKLC